MENHHFNNQDLSQNLTNQVPEHQNEQFYQNYQQDPWGHYCQDFYSNTGMQIQGNEFYTRLDTAWNLIFRQYDFEL